MLYALKTLIFMSKPALAATLLLSLSAPSWSQVDSGRAERSLMARPAKPTTEDPEQRRAAVRAALGQEQKANTPDEPPKARRQLTPEERQVLRQQLRQQPSEPLGTEKHADKAQKPLHAQPR